MTKRTKEELEAIAALEQFAASPPVIAKPTKNKTAEPEVDAPPAPKKTSKAKQAKQSPVVPEVKAARPPNKVLQKFNSLGWMSKGMIILIILGIIAEIIKKL
jgi:hypothetical protein